VAGAPEEGETIAGRGALMPAPTPRTVTVWQGRVPLRVLVKGAGPPAVFFDGPWGLTWGPFLDALAERFTVHAPEHPGTTEGQPDTVQQIDSLWDLVLCYDEMLDRLGLAEAALVGHSFGGMIACEVAVARPLRARSLVLIDPIGLWRDDVPVTNWMTQVAPPDLPKYVFHDPAGPAARALFSLPDDPEQAAIAKTRLTWAMGSSGKFIWPIPDKGLKKRIHRVQASSLLVWGQDDQLVPLAYADEFARRLSRARIEIVKDAGHAPHLEQPQATAELIRAFLEQG
jgi:pimeloyl-ACP methyl ester carboxylesterase